MRKHCTLARKTSLSVFLKAVSQAKCVSELYPEYELTWDHPVETDELLMLDTTVNPMEMRGDYAWTQKIGKVLVLPGTKKAFESILKREVEVIEG